MDIALSDTAMAPAFPARPRFPASEVLGIRIDDVPPDALVEEMARSMASGERLLVLHANAWLLTLAKDDPDIRRRFNRANIVYADSVGAQFAAYVLTGARPARSSAPEWMDLLGRKMATQNSSIFWLGGKESVIRKAAEAHSAATGVRVAGWHHGFFDKSRESAENQAVVDEINASGADFLVLNMGMPAQEHWIDQNWDALQVTVALTAGALADRVAGLYRRPPPWMVSCGLEWAHRLAVEPRRLWRRYLIGLPVFALQILGELARARSPLTHAARTSRRDSAAAREAHSRGGGS